MATTSGAPELPCTNDPARHPIRDDIPYDDPIRFAAAELTGANGEGLSTAEWLAVLDELFDLGCINLTMVGDRLFRRADWLELAQAVLYRDMALAIETTGLDIHDDALAELGSLLRVRVGVTLDAASRDEYQRVHGVDGFDRAWAALDRLRAQDNITPFVVTSFSRVNIDEVGPLADLLSDTGLVWQTRIASCTPGEGNHDAFITARQYGNLLRELAALSTGGRDAQRNLSLTMLEDMGYFPLSADLAPAFGEWWGCQAGLKIAAIRANGDVLGCLSLGDDFVEANVRERSLTDIWCSPKGFHALRRKSTRLSGACRTCPQSRTCRAGCTAMAYRATGDIVDNPLCLRRIECEEVLARVLPEKEPVDE